MERAGLFFPRYDDQDAEDTIARESSRFIEVMPGEERELDAVLMGTPVRTESGWTRAELHIGVVVSKGMALHVKMGELAKVEHLKKLGVTRIMRPEALA